MSIFYAYPQPTRIVTFIRRPQRFLVEVRPSTGAAFLAYCANPGAFIEQCKSGLPTLISLGSVKERKLPYTWSAIKLGRVWVGTDTSLSNKLAKKLVEEQRIPSLSNYKLVATEPTTTNGNRLDLHLSDGKTHCYIEVKSVMIAADNVARYPDSRSPRSIVQLNELSKIAKRGERAVLLFIIQRNDVETFKFNIGFSTEFYSALKRALNAGVETIAIKFKAGTKGFEAPTEVPVQ